LRKEEEPHKGRRREEEEEEKRRREEGLHSKAMASLEGKQAARQRLE